MIEKTLLKFIALQGFVLPKNLPQPQPGNDRNDERLAICLHFATVASTLQNSCVSQFSIPGF